MARPITLEDVVELPGPGLGGPVQARFGPSSDIVTWLEDPSGRLDRQLWGFDLSKGERFLLARAPGGGVREGELSLEEQLRRERLRERGLGISRYYWVGDKLVVPSAGTVWIQRGLDGSLEPVVQRVQSPRFDPAGERLAFVRDAEVHAVSLEGGEPVQITHGAAEQGRTHGIAEFAAQEEMNRLSGFWWSPDGARIAYTEVDEQHIPVWRIPHQGRSEPTWEDHRYPFAGGPNARVSLWVTAADGRGEPVRIVLETPEPWEYLARVCWLADGALVALVQDRRQTTQWLLRADVVTGRSEVVRTEHSDVWLNLHDIVVPLADRPGGFVWAVEDTGFRHLVRIDPDGSMHPLTSGQWMVDDVVAVDEAGDAVFFLATEADPRERQLYRTRLSGGGAVERLTHEPGWHTVTIHTPSGRLIDRHSAHDRPEQTVVRTLDGDVLADLTPARDARIDELELRSPELVDVPLDGGEVLHGALYADAGGPRPLVVAIYGGPHAQRVTSQWSLTADLWCQFLRQQGYAVLKLDNRGSARRGLAFEAALRWDMGRVELLDQIEAIRQLAEAGRVDPSRVAIQGWSYGGYLAAMALARFHDHFHAAIAGAPVTHWDGYDTHYTERYMGLPADNPDGYAVSSVMHHVAGMQGALLLIHGMLDENVHFRHTGRLLSELLAQGKAVDLQIYPDERHAPRDPAGRLYMLQRQWDFLQQRLPPRRG